MIIKYFVFLMLFSMSLSVEADRLILSVASYHVGSEQRLNEFNPGVGYEWDRPRDRWQIVYGAGVYYNSYEKTSVYGTIAAERGMFGVMAGLATGYELETSSGVLPIFAGYIQVPIQAIKLRILAAPGSGLVNKDDDVDAVIALQVVY